MDLGLVVMWKMVVTPGEFRLIQRALRSVLTEEERAQALVLQEQLMRDRATQAKHFFGEAEKSVKNIDKVAAETEGERGHE